MIARIRHWLAERKKTHGAKRSPFWPHVRREHLAEHPACAACGATTALEVHHVVPFHRAPLLELVASNLITLCEGPQRCHLLIGHGGDFRLQNSYVREDAARARAGQRGLSIQRAHDAAHGSPDREAA